MSSRTRTMLAAMVCLAGPALLFAHQPVTKTNVVKMTATIQAIDASTRTITLRDEKGNEDSFTAGEGVQRFNELKVGQRVNITYYESLVLQLVKPGEKAGGESFEAALNRAKGSLPA